MLRKFLLALAVCSSMSVFAVSIDEKGSSFHWEGKKVTGSHNGKIFLKANESKLVLKEDKSIDVGTTLVMDMTTFTVDDLEGKTAQNFLGHMKSADFFNVAEFNTAKFVVEKVEGNKIVAKVTIKGITNTENVSFVKDDKTFSGNFVFDRTKYDMKYNSGNFFKDIGDKAIYDDVSLKFSLKLL